VERGGAGWPGPLRRLPQARLKRSHIGVCFSISSKRECKFLVDKEEVVAYPLLLFLATRLASRV
jgi:hypothetical protein